MYNFLNLLRKKYIALLPELTAYREVVVLKQYFTQFECESIINIGNKIQLHPGRVLGSGDKFVVDSSLRSVSAGTIYYNKETSWIFEKLEDVVNKVNKLSYQFKLISFGEGLQFIRYTPGGHYVWHKDFGKNKLSKRKLSITVQLTDPSEYEGGELEFQYGKRFVASKDLGTAIIFPSFELHRVQPIKSGLRHVLVGWMSGPSFR